MPAEVTQPVLKLEVAFAYGPFDMIEEGWWTDITTIVNPETSEPERRMKQITYNRGRQDRLAAFEPATLNVTLDSSDRMLDPTYEDSLCYAPDGLGLPLSPVRLTATFPDDATVYPLFKGFIYPEGWPVDAANHGPHATVELQAVDPLGWYSSVALPASAWTMQVAALEHPDNDPLVLPPWWIRGDIGFPLIEEGGTVPNEGTEGGNASVVGPPGSFLFSYPGLVPGDESPAMVLDTDVSLVIDKADLFPSGDVDDATFAVVFRVPGNPVDTIELMSLKDGATDRFIVTLEGDAGDVGTISLACYDAGGTLSTYVSVPSPPGGGTEDWADGNAHLLVVRIEGGVNAALYVDRQQVDSVVGVPGVVREGDLTFGPHTVSQLTVDEVLMWPIALTTGQIYSLQGVFMGNQPDVGDVFPRDDFATRISRYYDLANLTVGIQGPDALEPEQWHAADPEAITFWGLGGLVSTMPSTLADGLRQVATDTGGACYALRDGRVRVRSLDALDAAEHVDDYATITVNLTDDVDGADPTPPPVPRGPVKRTGTRFDRIINEAAVSFGPDAEEIGAPDFDLPLPPVTIFYRDEASQARYGVLRDELTTSVIGWEMSAYLGQNRMVPEPPIEIEAIRLNPAFDQDLCDWVIKVCELEKAVRLSVHPEIGDPWTADLNVMGESWDWTPQGWTVDLNLADLRGDPA